MTTNQRHELSGPNEGWSLQAGDRCARYSGAAAIGFGEHFHVDVLKVQHHGSENKMDSDFAAKVSADQCIYCGNGEHENPDLRMIDILLNSQSNDAKPFHFWFGTTCDAQTEGSKKREYFAELEGP